MNNRSAKPAIQGTVTEAREARENKRVEMGFMGKLFGDVDHKPGNIAGFAILMSMIMLGVLFIAPDSESLPKRDGFTLFSGIITAALGFLFGRTSSGTRR